MNHQEADEMIHQLDMQIRKSHRKQQSPGELMKQLAFVSKKPRKSKKPIVAPKPRDYVYSGGIKINRSPYVIRKEHTHSAKGKDHSSTSSCTAPEATSELVNLIICFLCVPMCMHADLLCKNR